MNLIPERIATPHGCLTTIGVIALGITFFAGAVAGHLLFQWLKQ